MTTARFRSGSAESDGAGRAVRAVIWLPGLAVAVGAAVATAHGLFEVALAARVPAGIAWLYPLITDGLALVAYAATARLHGAAARYAWTVVVLAAGLSGLAQAVYLSSGATLDATPGLRFGVGAWPAVAAAVVAHLLYLLAADGRDIDIASAAAGTQRDHRGQFPVVSDAAPAGVQPGVHPGLYTPPGVQPALYTPVSDSSHLETSDASPPPWAAAADGPVEQLHTTPVERAAGPVEHPAEGRAGSAPGERARAAAVRHATRHGALPTVSELKGLAAVSRGTAAAALKNLREHPSPLHLVPNSPDPRNPR